MYCSFCGGITVCSSISYPEPPQVQRLSEINVWCFARLRECQSCGNPFETVEVDAIWTSNVQAEIRRIREEFDEKMEKALGANELILSWRTELDLKIHSIERSLEDLRSLKEKINLATERLRFMRITKE